MEISLSAQEILLARQLAPGNNGGAPPQIGKRPLYVVPIGPEKITHDIIHEFDLEFGDATNRYAIVFIPQTY